MTLKGHKQNFRTNPKWRLINPTKSEQGKVSRMLERIKSELRKKFGENQWKTHTNNYRLFPQPKKQT